MFRQFFLLFISSTTVLLVDADDCVTVESEGHGNWQGLIQLGPFEEDVTSWNIIITFTDPLDWLESVMAEVSGTGTSWSLASKDWDGEISAGESLGVRFRVGYSGNKPWVSWVSYDTEACGGVVTVTQENAGQWGAQVKLDAGEEDVEGWRLDLEFSSHVDWLESAMAEASGAGPQWRLTSRSWDNNIPAGGHLDLKFLVDYSAARPSVLTLTFNERELCNGGTICVSPTPSPTTSTTTRAPPSTTGEDGCCGPQSFPDPLCNDVPNDPNGGLGCKACGIQDCRLCGEDVYIACP